MKTQPLRAALAQMNSTVGDIAGNAARIAEFTGRARAEGAQLVVFPELALTGYPPEDLLLKTHFLAVAGAALKDLAASTRGIVALVGFPERADDVYNSAAVLADGEVAAVYRKMHLPNYGVFDEQRYFQAGAQPATFDLGGVRIGLTICEDIWEPGHPATAESLAGAEVIVNLCASPYHLGKGLERERMLAQRARDNLVSVLLCNAVGGQDELVFDGQSVALDQAGGLLARSPQFEEALTLCTVQPGPVAAARLRDPRHRAAVRRERGSDGMSARSLASLDAPTADAPALEGLVAGLLSPEAEVYAALRTGLRDYTEKNRFERVVLGLSGGIDSALVALLAVDALGPERVSCVVMPSPYSSSDTQSDARAIAGNLGADLIELCIEAPMAGYDDLLREAFAGRDPDITEENLQARIRGNLLMALSNKFGWLVLTTGNKSELSVGYATLYGDMAGGFAVLKDVFKQWVYRLVEWRNGQDEQGPVPASVLDRPPSAELREEQRDDQTLPPYEVLDAILAGYVEQDLDAADLEAQGHPVDDVERVIRMVDRAEYKLRQAPPGIRISTKAFGRDRRLPITNRYESRT
ncbi:MAG: NAD+ synthase [Thermoleophilaceae bacterium]|nr:NAD+ synthase [Thermoleophilaceae bacterium]